MGLISNIKKVVAPVIKQVVIPAAKDFQKTIANEIKDTVKEAVTAVVNKAIGTAPDARPAVSNVYVPQPNRNSNLGAPLYPITLTNGCGPTTMAMDLKYFGIDAKPADIFKSNTIGHSPVTMANELEKRGMAVRQVNGASYQDLPGLIDNGIPVIAYGINGGGKSLSVANLPAALKDLPNSHYVLITGYKTDKTGQVTHVYYNDGNKPTTQLATIADFSKNFWGTNSMPGGSNYFMAAAPKTDAAKMKFLNTYYPADRMTASYSTALTLAGKLENEFYALEKSPAAKNVTQVASTIINTIAKKLG